MVASFVAGLCVGFVLFAASVVLGDWLRRRGSPITPISPPDAVPRALPAPPDISAGFHVMSFGGAWERVDLVDSAGPFMTVRRQSDGEIRASVTIQHVRPDERSAVAAMLKERPGKAELQWDDGEPYEPCV